VNLIEKRGIGTELIKSFIQRAKELGASSIRLTTDTYGNEGVNAFYQK
jgi:GNAT superfamily N-acetyltransferase